MSNATLAGAPTLEGRAVSRRPGYVALYEKRVINAPSKSSVVATRNLREALIPLLAKIERELQNPHLQSEHVSGAQEALCARASAMTDLKPATLYRRLYGILRETTRSTGAHIADALMLGAGTTLRDEGVMELPAGLPAAQERIDIYCELRGVTLSRKVRKELAADLYEFALLMIHGVEEDLLEVAA